MLLDWIGREGWIIFNWWLLVSLAGAAVLPLLIRLLDRLPDRGYTLARPAGLLLVGFVFWLLAILGFVNNSTGSVLLAWLIVIILSCVVYFTSREALKWRDWWHENRTVVLVTEVLFVVLLIGWAVFRAYQNDLTTTEKPMDLAFMSAVQHSQTFPPNDPWLSGYAISYYYFGHVMSATLSTLAGVPTTIGYNMHIALLFALTGTTVFGVVYNLVRSRAGVREKMRFPTRATAAWVGALAVVFVTLMGNFHLAFVEWPYQTGKASEVYLRFWDVDQRREPMPEYLFEATSESTNSRANVTRWDYWWWFRAPRAIDDKDLSGNHIEVIAEFPQFSFLLGDSHPHVMALPFAVMMIGLALNVLLAESAPDARRIIFYGVCVGGLIFLNTWDAPIYLALLVGAEALRRWIRNRQLDLDDGVDLVILGGSLAIVAGVASSPFLVGFRSQLNGILPNLINPTQFQQFFLMFGPFLFVLLIFLGVELWRSRGTANWRLGGILTGGIVLTAIIMLLFITLIGWATADIRHSALRYISEYGGWGEVLSDILSRRTETLPTLAVLLAFLIAILARLLSRYDETRPADTYPAAAGFTLLLVGGGVLLILVPEFVYLRDQFSTRMNTVFKFYYQAWAMFSVAAAYGVYTVLFDHEQARPAPIVRGVFGVLLIGVLIIGLAYPVLGTYHRMFVETGRTSGYETALTLDGGPGFISRDDYSAIMCLRDLVGRQDVVVAEANPQGSRVNYNPIHGRVGSLTGIPVVIGWPGHQSQWRGTGYADAVGTRQQDLDTLYTDLRLDVVARIIEQYNIDYIVYGATERLHYGSGGEIKLMDSYELVCESGGTHIYRVSRINGR